MSIPSSAMPLYEENDDVEELGVATKLISLHARRNEPKNKPIITPIYHSVMYYMDKCEDFKDQCTKGYIYQRVTNANCDELSMVISQIEHGKGTANFPCGMAAISNTLLCFLKPGDHIVVQSPLYGGNNSLLKNVLPKFNIEVTYVDASADVECYREATKENTAAYYAETICNPMMWYLDVEKLGRIAKESNILTIVDATLSSPINQTTLDYGIDIVLHSSSKYMGGHSDMLAGCVTFNDLELYAKLRRWQFATGVFQTPHDSAQLLRSLRSLHVRMERHNENGMKIAKFLDEHPKVVKVYYLGLPSHPQHKMACRTLKGFGGMIAFELGSREDSIKFVESTRVFKHSVSLGGAESLIEHPTSINNSITNPEELGYIPDTLIRMSVGIEDVKDQIADIQQAFDKIGKSCKNGD